MSAEPTVTVSLAPAAAAAASPDSPKEAAADAADAHLQATLICPLDATVAAESASVAAMPFGGCSTAASDSGSTSPTGRLLPDGDKLRLVVSLAPEPTNAPSAPAPLLGRGARTEVKRARLSAQTAEAESPSAVDETPTKRKGGVKKEPTATATPRAAPAVAAEPDLSLKRSTRVRKQPPEQTDELKSAPPQPAAAAPATSEPFSFPPFPDAQLPDVTGPFDASFARFAADIYRHEDASQLFAPARSSRAPSSQPLHAVRSAIYRELCEEYFGRFLKETPDVQEDDKVERGVQRSSTRAAAVKIAARHLSPEQLRMIFYSHLNRCEADRVPSSAGRSEKTGLVMVTPLTAAMQLKSLAACDTTSLRAGDYTNVPSTLRHYQAAMDLARQPGRVRVPSPPPINPHFDLFQFEPFVVSDQYEEILDDLSHQMRQTEADHPTLPNHAAARTPLTQDQAKGHAASGHAEAAASIAATPAPSPLHAPLSTPLGAYGGNHLRTTSEVGTTVEVGHRGVPDVPPFASVTIASSLASEAPSMEAQSPAGPPPSHTPDVEMADATGSARASENDSPSILEPSPLPSPLPAADDLSSTLLSVASPESAHSSGDTAARSLPATAHGVGMFASLDFASPRCASFKTHWTSSCYSWRFDNATRVFSATAYNPSNVHHNDVAHVTGVLQQAQQQFHDELLQDEREEREWEQSQAKFSRRVHAKKQKREDGAETEPPPNPQQEQAAAEVPAASVRPANRPYSPDSPEYAALRARIRSSFEAAVSNSLFLPHTYLRDVAPRLHERAVRMSAECVESLVTKFKLPADEQPVDSLLGLVVPGFGCKGTQLFLKVGLCVTLLHDEIGWSSALNYMTARSRGCALWIGLNMHKASVKLSKDRLRHLINATTFNLADFMAQLRKAGLQPCMQIQTPGTCIYSPCGRGSAHIVITVGSWVEQIAINEGMGAAGVSRALSFWDGVEPLLHNSALATRCVIPLLWLQKHMRWEVGLEDQLAVLAALERQVRAEGKHAIHYRDYSSPADEEVYCRRCFNQQSARRAILFISIAQLCPACFVDTHDDYTHMRTMIDRRFK